MSRTARLLTTVAAIVLTLVIMSVGIYAASRISLTNPAYGNAIIFEAKDVAATVTAKRQMGTNTAQDLAVTGSDNSTIANGEFAPAFQQGQEYAGTIDVGNIQFTDLSDTFTLTIEVTNDLSSAAINVLYNANTTDTNGYVDIATTLTNDGTVISNTTDGIDVAAGKTLVITTTITVVQDKVNTILDQGLNIPFVFTLDLSRATPAA